MKLRGFNPNFRINVSVSDLYIPTVGPPILLQQYIGGPIVGIQIAHRYINVGIKNEAVQFDLWEFYFEFLVQCLCSLGFTASVLGSRH
jgi:hypothetical protein